MRSHELQLRGTSDDESMLSSRPFMDFGVYTCSRHIPKVDAQDFLVGGSIRSLVPQALHPSHADSANAAEMVNALHAPTALEPPKQNLRTSANVLLVACFSCSPLGLHDVNNMFIASHGYVKCIQ